MAPKTIRMAILDTLERLSVTNLEKFCSQLLDRREQPRVPLSKIENKRIVGITDVLVSTFCESGARQVVLEVLRDIDCNEEANQLESDAKSIGQVPEPGSFYPQQTMVETTKDNMEERKLIVDELLSHSSTTKACVDKGDPTFRKTSTGELETKPSEEARKYADRQCPLGEKPPQKKPEEVKAEAKARVLSEGGDPNDDWLVLSRCTIQFGKYRSQTFKWLLENDVGYTAYIVASDLELKYARSQKEMMANKDSLTQYVKAYPEFLKVKALHSAQNGKARVGFGVHAKKTLKNLYESKDPKIISYVNFLRDKKSECQPGSKMQTAVEYISLRDQQLAAASSDRPTTSGAPQGPPKFASKRKCVQSTGAASRSKLRKQK